MSHPLPAQVDTGPVGADGLMEPPLYIAIKRRRLDCVRLLIKHDVGGLGEGAFLEAAIRGDQEDAAVALVKAGEAVERTDEATGEWPLYVAARKNLGRVLGALADAGADFHRVGTGLPGGARLDPVFAGAGNG